VQSRVIRERLMREAESNVAIRVSDTPGGEAFEVAGRGELQMGVLIENMRREGFELSISRPRVLTRDENGQRLEPVEEVTIDVDDEFTGVVIEKLTGPRKGELVEMKPAGAGKTRIIAHVPVARADRLSRRIPDRHARHRRAQPRLPWLGAVERAIQGRRAGVLISMENGTSVAYALFNLEDRGQMFIGAQEPSTRA
jgi:GTP-binding protein